MADWEARFLEALRQSRPAWDEPPDWRAALSLYEGLGPEEAAALDRLVLRMIDEGYRNPHSSRENLPLDDVMVNLPEGMVPEDLLCVEAAVMVAAERGLGQAYFALNRLMRSPRWHAFYPRLIWLGEQGLEVQRKLASTDAGRYAGALLGLACGDALGVTVEFRTREEIRQAYPEGHREIRGGGPFGFAPGEWSDDTAMTLAVAFGIAESPEDPVEAVGRRFMAWYESHPPDVGNTVRMALESYRALGSWQKASEAVAASLGDRAAGNGALMRTLPTALAYGPSVEQAIRIARMTHPHPESDAAVVAYHTAVWALLQGASRAEAVEAGVGASGPLAQRLSRVPKLRTEEVRSTGYVVDTLEAAFWAFLHTDSLEECIVTAVGLGDDADTVGAVAGGLAGVHYGVLAVPRRWSAVLKGRAELDAAAESLYALRH
ncbi:MAG TPA: ADP-ribosylglycohydrolase family protein [Symbiobacteriaceae bacterium]